MLGYIKKMYTQIDCSLTIGNLNIHTKDNSNCKVLEYRNTKNYFFSYAGV